MQPVITLPQYNTKLTTEVIVVNKNKEKQRVLSVEGREFAVADNMHFFRVSPSSKPEKHLGQIILEIKEKAISVFFMYADNSFHRDFDSNVKKKYLNVGRALHELAVRYSFFSHKEGHVELSSINDVCGFHFRIGFRFTQPEPMVNPNIVRLFPISLVNEFNTTCESYLQMTGESKAEAAEVIKGNAIYQIVCNAAFQELKRDPKDVDEALEYGIYVLWSVNSLLERFYSGMNYCKAKICNPPNQRFEFEGAMSLSEKAIQEWRQSLGIKK